MKPFMVPVVDDGFIVGLDDQQWQHVALAVHQLPYNVALSILEAMQSQINSQIEGRKAQEKAMEHAQAVAAVNGTGEHVEVPASVEGHA